MYNINVKRSFVITEIMHMNAGVSSEKEKGKQSQSQSQFSGIRAKVYAFLELPKHR